MNTTNPIAKLWNSFLCLFSPKVSPLVEELLRLMAKFPDEFEAEVKHYAGLPTVCIRLTSGITNIIPAMGAVFCIQPDRMFLDTPYDGITELNRREVVAVVGGITEWSKS